MVTRSGRRRLYFAIAAFAGQRIARRMNLHRDLRISAERLIEDRRAPEHALTQNQKERTHRHDNTRADKKRPPLRLVSVCLHASFPRIASLATRHNWAFSLDGPHAESDWRHPCPNEQEFRAFWGALKDARTASAYRASRVSWQPCRPGWPEFATWATPCRPEQPTPMRATLRPDDSKPE